MTILVTGSEGLIGRHLISRLLSAGIPVRPYDIARNPREDTRNADTLGKVMDGVTGVVHLAAISRVVWAERDPATCASTNIEAFETLLRLSKEQRTPPWILFVSSREVYGTAERFPVTEDMPFRPVNTYARSKVRGEELAQEAADAGLLVNTCRLSSVYGCPLDHKDRVAMAFAGAAALGGTIVLEGVSNTFDFTDVRDVAKGVDLLVQATIAGEKMPPIHFVSGKGTTLIDLAEMAQAHALKTVTMREAPPRDFDVAHFVGDPARAKSLLGWSAEIEIEDGMRRLISRMADHHAAGHSGERMTGRA